MNKLAVLERLEPLTNMQVRQVEHQPKTRVVVTPDMVILKPGSGGRSIPMSENGVKAMATFIGMPTSMGQRLSPDTFGKVATELLSRKERYNLLLDEGQISDFANYHGLRTINPERLVSIIDRTIPDVNFHRVTLMENHSAQIEVIGDKRQPVARGDLIQAGTMITFSPINTIKPAVQSYVLRLACTNGATSNNIVREYGAGGEGDDIWQWFRESIKGAYGALGGIVNRYQQMMDEKIPAAQRAMMLEALLKEAKISGDDADAVRAQALAQPPRNTYELVNLITWASSHVIREPGRIRQALTAAATFTDETEHRRICPVCHINR